MENLTILEATEKFSKYGMEAIQVKAITEAKDILIQTINKGCKNYNNLFEKSSCKALGELVGKRVKGNIVMKPNKAGKLWKYIEF